MKKTVNKLSNFDQLVMEAVDEALGVLGPIPRQTLYEVLFNFYSLAKEEIPSRIDEFDAALRNALGSAAITLERLILKGICSRVGTRFTESAGYSFGEKVREIKRFYDLDKSQYGRQARSWSVG